MTRALLVPIFCLLLVGCTNYERFGAASPEVRPAAPVAAQTWRDERPRPLLACTATCRRECRGPAAPKWCMFYKPPA